MIKISDVVRELVTQNPHLSFGLANRIFNLTQLSQFLQPMIETKLKKEVRPSAILMNLSRLQQDYAKETKLKPRFQIENITIQSNLVTMTYYKNDRTESQVEALSHAIRERNGYFGWNEGMNEHAVIFEARFLEASKQYVQEEPKFVHDSVSALIIKFPKEYSTQPGFLYTVLRTLALHNVNVIEATSTFSEFTVYIDRKDIQLAFEALELAFTQASV
jgi:hypothetical protein